MKRTLVGIVVLLAIGYGVTAVHHALVKTHVSGSELPCINNLRQIDSAKNQYALEHGVTNGTPLTWENLCPYISDISNKVFCSRAPAAMRCLTNYSIKPLGVDAVCNIIGAKGGHCLTNHP